MSTAHIYEAMIGSSPEKIWNAITDGEITQKYYFDCRVESNWTPGSEIRYYNPDGSLSSEGEVLAIEPQRLLKTTFIAHWFSSEGTPSTVSWEIQDMGDTSLVTLTQDNIDDKIFEEAELHIGWVYVLSNLKSVIETGKPLPKPNIF